MTSRANVWPSNLDASIGGSAVVAVLDQRAGTPALQTTITAGHGPEFTGRALHLLA